MQADQPTPHAVAFRDMTDGLERRKFMHQLEVLAKNEEEALAKASKQADVDVKFLEVLEEYEPDEQDLQDYAKDNNLDAAPSASEITLYMVRIAFPYYVEKAQEFTQGLIERFAPGSKAEAIRFRNIIIIRLDVPEASILIGKQGATLDALQHVVVRALLTIDEDFPDVMLDVERYREKKLIRLEKEAKGAADRALRTGRPVPLTPMSPAERKFIHNMLKEVEGVKTESRGEDRRRHIVVEAINPVRRPERRGGGFGGNREGREHRGGRGGRGGHDRGQTSGRGGSQRPPSRQISEEQRALLYGKGGGKRRDFADEDINEKKTLLPEYNPKDIPDDYEEDGQLRFMDEIDDQLR